jgi:hypothetical protein
VPHRWDNFLATARVTASRRGRELSAPEVAALQAAFEAGPRA